ncbi:MAG: Nif3-like dinuclear metal center hexameric protein [Bacteroidota bacterium]
MIVKDINNLLEVWAPKNIAWEKDNVGLQVGSYSNPALKILVALDATEEVIDEAVKKNADLIITHHPLIFEPLKNVTTNDDQGRLIFKLIESKISLIAVHTNLDFTKGGVSFALAQKLDLTNIKILKKSNNHLKKIVVFVPSEYTEKVTDAMASAGAGIIGNYEYCSYRSPGVGTFKGSIGSKPFIGKAGEIEKVDEIRLEMIVPDWKIAEVTDAISKSHPYEEPAYDIYPVENESTSYGAGTIGTLEEELTQKKFLQHVKEKLSVESIRYVVGAQEKIKTVAVCGGSGSNLFADALALKADAFVTGDVTYHLFQQAKGKILLVDAGHFETEIYVVETIVNYLKNKFALLKENIQVIQTTHLKNTIQNI